MLERDKPTNGGNRGRSSAETTQDLHQLRPTLPHSHAEMKTRIRGPWMIATGLAIIVMTVILGAVWHVGFHTDMPLVFVMPLYAVGFGGLYLGCMEYLSRPVRENHLHTIAQLKQIEHGLMILAEMLPEEMKQRFYRGYARCAEDLGAATGTDGGTPARGTANVLRLRRPG